MRNFIVEYRKIPLRPVKNYDKHIKNSEAINGERLVLPQARSEGGPRARFTSTIYTWST